MFPRVRKGLAGARVDDGLLGQQGEADRGQRGTRLGHLPFLHELTHCKTCVASSPSHGRKRRENERWGRGEELKNA